MPECKQKSSRQVNNIWSHARYSGIDIPGHKTHSYSMPKRSSNIKKDLNKLASSIVDQATGEAPSPIDGGKNPAAVALGRLGGLRGGKARAKSLSAKKRKQIAAKAAKTRWKKHKKTKK